MADEELNTQLELLAADNAGIATNPVRHYSGVMTLSDRDDIDLVSVTKSNHLVAAQNSLPARQQKVLAACIAMIDPTGDYDEPEVKGITVELTDDQLVKLTGIEKRYLMRFIRDTAEDIQSKPIRHPKSEEGDIDVINIALRSRYDKVHRKFCLTFHPMLVEHLIQLNNYTSYRVKYLRNLSSKYAIRMYEIICMIYNRKQGGVQFKRISLENLAFSLGFGIDDNGKGGKGSSYYEKNFAEVRRRVLGPAQKEINESTNMRIEYEPYYAGRRITGLTFRIWQIEEREVIANQPLNELPEEDGQVNVKAELIRVGVSQQVASRWMEQYTEDRLIGNIKRFHQRKLAGEEIHNPSAYLGFLITKNIAALPPVADPFSSRYKTQPEVRDFVKRIVVKIWWDLAPSLRSRLEEEGNGLVGDLVTGEDVISFIEYAKQFGSAEAEEGYPPDAIKEKWNRAEESAQ